MSHNAAVKGESATIDGLVSKAATTLVSLLLAGGLILTHPFARADTVEVPSGASTGLYANVWAERYRGADAPAFSPAPQLEPRTNYLLLVDVAVIPYFDGRGREPGGVSVPLNRLARLVSAAADPPYHFLVSQLVVEDKTYHPENTPHFFGIHGKRAVAEELWSLRGSLAKFQASDMEPVDRSALDLLRSAPEFEPPAWLLERSVFRVRVNERTGAAPLGVAFRTREAGTVDAVSLRFCVEALEDANRCDGLPRESEYMAAQLAGDPPPLPDDIDFPVEATAAADAGAPFMRTPTWNSWVSRQGDGMSRPVPALDLQDGGVQSMYVLHVELSLYQYFALLGHPPDIMGAASADDSFRALVRERLDQGDTRLRLVVRAEEIGDAFEIRSGSVQTLEVDLTRLDPEGDAPDIVADSVTLDRLSELTAATSMTIGLEPQAPGCGAVALSVADATGIRPLDHLVHTVEVRRASQPIEGCRSPGTSSLGAGLGRMLRHADAPPVDAALHVFELFPGDRRAAAAFLIGAGDVNHSWELPRPLTEYLMDPDNLEQRILDARRRTSNGVAHAYDLAARELAGAIFAGMRPGDQREADAARRALQSFVASAPGPPTLLAKLTGRDDEPLFLPLGLLAAPGDRAVLNGAVNVVLPLPKEDYGESGCLRDWTVAVSDSLEGAELVPVPDDLKQAGLWLGDSLEDLRGYLTEDVEASDEGLVVAAHHDGGRLRYHQNDFWLQAQDIRRNYGNATAAVLAMCGAGAVDPVDRLLIERLNNFGLDAAILSPFSLDAVYGKTFAIEFSRRVRDALDAGRRPALRELFDEAAAATATTLAQHPDPSIRGKVGDMHLELVVVGNPGLRLCGD